MNVDVNENGRVYLRRISSKFRDVTKQERRAEVPLNV
jgi:hypothetical protein